MKFCSCVGIVWLLVRVFFQRQLLVCLSTAKHKSDMLQTCPLRVVQSLPQPVFGKPFLFVLLCFHDPVSTQGPRRDLGLLPSPT